MWTVIKFDKKNLEFLKKDFKQKLGQDVIIYCPKFLLQKYKNNKLIKKELRLLGDYLFCFHSKFKNSDTFNLLKFTRGLKYFLNGFLESQEDINKFIKKCRECENEKGYLTQSFFKILENKDYKFTSGPFSDKIFKIINFEKNKLNILLGNINTTLKLNDYSFKPL